MTANDFSFRNWEPIILPPGSGNTMLLTFDLEECEKFQEKKPAGQRIPDPGSEGAELDMFSLSYQGGLTLLKILERDRINATFFVTLSFARRYPDFIVALCETGHEIGVHAYEHGDNYREMWKEKPQACKRRILEAKKGIEEFACDTVMGFRAPQLQAPPPAFLKECGFLYDSSLHPTYVPGRYNHLWAKRHLSRDGDFFEVPISVTPLLRLPFSWFWFRNLGPGYVKFCTRWSMRSLHFCNIYFHPWDFYPLSNFDFISKSYKKNTDRMPQMFSDYIRWCKERGYVFETVGGWLGNVKP